MKRQRGFTLIEIAIVLVIIGLLLGGVLKGQELITNAKIKRVNNDFNGIGAAVYSYLERYNALPGDDPNTTRWGASVAVGDNDGVIEGNWNSTTTTEESRLAWDHLRRSNLIGGGSGTSFPTNAFGGRIGVEDENYGMTGTVICMEDLEGKIAAIVDTQLDDSMSNAGLLRSATATTAATGDASYDLVTSYSVCKQI
jgi:prepilin-type N-terminal cleavage/methylation domain-containing protein